jgi:hypothetical protein
MVDQRQPAHLITEDVPDSVVDDARSRRTGSDRERRDRSRNRSDVVGHSSARSDAGTPVGDDPCGPAGRAAACPAKIGTSTVPIDRPVAGNRFRERGPAEIRAGLARHDQQGRLLSSLRSRHGGMPGSSSSWFRGPRFDGSASTMRRYSRSEGFGEDRAHHLDERLSVRARLARARSPASRHARSITARPRCRRVAAGSPLAENRGLAAPLSGGSSGRGLPRSPRSPARPVARE